MVSFVLVGLLSTGREGGTVFLRLEAGGEPGGGGKDGLIAGVKGRAEEEDGGDAADDLGEVFGFVLVEGAAEEGVFAVAEPFFEDLVAAEGVVPDVDGDGGPEGFAIESAGALMLRLHSSVLRIVV